MKWYFLLAFVGITLIAVGSLPLTPVLLALFLLMAFMCGAGVVNDFYRGELRAILREFNAYRQSSQDKLALEREAMARYMQKHGDLAHFEAEVKGTYDTMFKPGKHLD